MLDRDIVCFHFPKERRPNVHNQLAFQRASLQHFISFQIPKWLHSHFGVFICGAEPYRKGMGTDLCFYCLHWGELAKATRFIFTIDQAPFLYAVLSGISVQFAGLSVWACYFLDFIVADCKKCEIAGSVYDHTFKIICLMGGCV